MVQPKRKKKKIIPVAIVRNAPVKRLNQKECRAIQKKAFLEAFENNPSFTMAAETAHVDRKSIFNWRQTDKAFADAIEKIKPNAKVNYLETLEEEARRRAKDGIDKPIYYRGELVATIKEYSDTLLMFLLNGAAPEKYHRERVEVTGRDDGPIVIKVVYDDRDKRDNGNTT